jgi:glucan 1,3-beta-glucosidase
MGMVENPFSFEIPTNSLAGNQQFTSRNMTFANCNTAIYMNFDWVWTFKSLSISGCTVGIDMSNGGTDSQTTGSVLVLDSTISAGTGIITNYVPNISSPGTAGTLVVENTDFRGSNLAITNNRGVVIVGGGTVVESFAQGNAYTTAGEQVTNTTVFNGTSCTNANSSQTAVTAQETTIQQLLAPIQKPANLLDSNGRVFERSKPQYEGLLASQFSSAISFGCHGDGVQDDTTCVQSFLNNALSTGRIAYFDHGAYKITSTVLVPVGIKIVGEIWPMIMASGFTNQADPQPVFRVGLPGETGSVEMSDLVFQTIGPNPGAILVEWNVAASAPGTAGMWDVHWRIGGSAGTQLQSDHCSKNPTVDANANPNCEGAFLLLHVTSSANIYLENTWLWTSDHDLDAADHNQLNIYNGRGMLIESEAGPVWMYGTSAEHNVLYNYQISHASSVWGGVLQTETAYFEANPNALQPYPPQSAFTDPTFATCTAPYCIKTWGLRIVDSTNIFIYGTGMYSFFDNYDSGCLDTESCQENMIDITNSTDIYMWAVSTKASTYMITFDDQGIVPQSPNQDTFCETIVLFEAV